MRVTQSNGFLTGPNSTMNRKCDQIRYMGIDLGTGSLRVVLLNDRGTIVSTASSPYGTDRGPSGEVEQSPSSWTSALKIAISNLEMDSPPDAIGLCGQTPTLIFVDEEGSPVRPAITWQDTRAHREATELEQSLGSPEPLFGTNLPWSASNIPARLLWITRHEPETRRRTRYVLQAKDYLGMYLTGNPSSDPWSSKGLCNVSDATPMSRVLSACGWDDEHCPPLQAAWALRGTVTRDAATSLGLRQGTPVAVGWSDALAQVLGSGCFAQSSAFFFSGTSTIVGAVVPDDVLRAAGLFNVPSSCAPRALLYGPTQSGGASLEWAARLLKCGVKDLPALASTARNSLPVFVPYLSGERAPLWNTKVRATLVGLDDAHGPSEIAMSVLLGVILAARNILDLIEISRGELLRTVEIVGRGVGDLEWERAASHAMGLALRLHDDQDMSARGAAILGAAGAGLELETASQQLTDNFRIIEPDSTTVAESREMLKSFREASRSALEWQRYNEGRQQ